MVEMNLSEYELIAIATALTLRRESIKHISCGAYAAKIDKLLYKINTGLVEIDKARSLTNATQKNNSV